MPNRRNEYYVGDTRTFRGVFVIDQDEQTPDPGSCTVKICKDGDNDNPIVNGAAGNIAGTELRYKYGPLTVGQYSLFFTASYNNGADTLTGIIEFFVKQREAH